MMNLAWYLRLFPGRPVLYSHAGMQSINEAGNIYDPERLTV